MLLRRRNQTVLPSALLFAFVVACAGLAFPVAAEATLGWSGPIAIDSGTALTGIDCTSASQCTAVDAAGRAVTFDPTSPGPFPPPTVVDQGAISSPRLAGVGCTLRPAPQCTTVDDSGREVTFNPSTFAILSSGTIDPGNFLVHFICRSSSQCTAIDKADQEVTFDPGPPLTALTPQVIDSGTNLGGVACPLVTQCVAVDGLGQAMTFNPNPFTVSTTLTPIDTGASLTAVVCPQTSQCDAIDNSGQEVRFDPTFPLPATRVTIDSGAQLNALTCATPSDCVAVGDNPRAVEGNPQQPALQWTIEPIPGAAPPLEALSCPSANGVVIECVVVDSAGNAFLGTPVLVPVNTALPILTGSTSQGQTLTASNGSWANSPTGYTYQWDDCDTSGGNCSAINGATSQAYTLGATDVGDRVEVSVTASNAAGSSTARSTASMVVTGVIPPLHAPGLTLKAVSAAGTSALVSLACSPGLPGQTCSGKLAMTVKERKRGPTVVAVSANSVTSGGGAIRRAGTTTAVVIVASGTYSIPAGGRVTATLALNSIGQTLLNQFYELPATVTLAGVVPQALGVTIAYPPLPVLVSGWNVYQSYTTLQLSVAGLPSKATVAVTCRGGGCPYRRRVKRAVGRQISLTGRFARSRLKPGVVVQIAVTAPESVEKIWTIRIRNALNPTQTKSCIPPGDHRPRACVT